MESVPAARQEPNLGRFQRSAVPRDGVPVSVAKRSNAGTARRFAIGSDSRPVPRPAGDRGSRTARCDRYWRSASTGGGPRGSPRTFADARPRPSCVRSIGNSRSGRTGSAPRAGARGVARTDGTQPPAVRPVESGQQRVEVALMACKCGNCCGACCSSTTEPDGLIPPTPPSRPLQRTRKGMRRCVRATAAPAASHPARGSGARAGVFRPRNPSG